MRSLSCDYALVRRGLMPPAILLMAALCAVGNLPRAYGQSDDDVQALAEKFKEAFSGRTSLKTEFQDFKEVTEDAKKHEGLLTLYEKDQKLYGEIKPNQFGKMLLAPMAIARGMASAGTPLNYQES